MADPVEASASTGPFPTIKKGNLGQCPKLRTWRMKDKSRGLNHDTLAVSAVISVILLVAIAVVLSATVFVMVSNLNDGGGGGQGPKLSAVSDSTTTSTSWKIKITDATKFAQLSDFQFAITTSTHGTIVVTPTASDFDPSQVWYADTTSATDTTRTAATTSQFANTQTGYRITFIDASGDEKFGTLDTIQVVYDSSTTDNAFDDALPSGNYRLDIRHITTDTASGSAKNHF